MFEHIRRQYPLISIPVIPDDLDEMAGRREAARCLEYIKELLPEYAFPRLPHFFSDYPPILDFLQTHRGDYLLKAPYSSSGRGLLRLSGVPDLTRRRMIESIIRKQHYIGLEPFLNRTIDFAAEYYSDGDGHCRFEGYSMFRTSDNGAYQGSLLASQSKIESTLQQYVTRDRITAVLSAVQASLEHVYARRYCGYMGVDMMIYDNDGEYCIHPCVEVNLRRTMGHVAIRLYEQYISPLSEGVFRIRFHKREGDAMRYMQTMSGKYPPIIREGRLPDGAVFLTPITDDTHFTAFMQASAVTNRERNLFEP
jgi:hypothetical protein